MISAQRTSSLAAAAIAMALILPAAQAGCLVSNPPLGSVCTTAATYCPNNYARADGRLLQVSKFPDLFSVLGSKYGDDGKSTFGLPRLNDVQSAGPLDQYPGIRCIQSGGMFPAR